MAKSIDDSAERDQLTEDESQRWYDLGRSAGLGEAANRLAKTAVEHFARHKDSTAKLLRGEADKLEAQAKATRPGPRPADTAASPENPSE